MFRKKEKRSPQAAKEERFKRIASRRVQDILAKMDLLGNCANKNNYSYTEEQAKKIVSVIDEKWKTVRKEFDKPRKTKERFVLD